MATNSIAVKSVANDSICQGDVFQNVKYNYIDTENNQNVEIVQFTFPLAVIISQACDVISMCEMEMAKAGKATKFMPSILMCPIYNATVAKKTHHLDNAFNKLDIKKLDGKNDVLINSDEYKVAKND